VIALHQLSTGRRQVIDSFFDVDRRERDDPIARRDLAALAVASHVHAIVVIVAGS
jgi:hypothetical protein